MGTRSTIALERNDGTVIQVYCHWDGYLSGVGATLYGYYNTPEKLEELIEMGDISSLDLDLESTVFYHRDRGEELQCSLFENYDIFSEDGDSQSYNYLMRGGELFYTRGASEEWEPLTAEVIETDD